MRLYCLDARSIDQLEGRRDDSRGDHRRDRVARRVERVIDSEQRPNRRRRRDQTHRDLRHDPEGPFGTDEETGQIEPHAGARTRAGAQERSVRQHHLESEDVIARHSVAQRVRTARVLRHIAPERASALAGGIRRVTQSVRRRGSSEMRVDHARLHHRHAVLRVELQDAIHAREAE